jgi:hypothetical protein
MNIYEKLFQFKEKELILKKNTEAFWYKYAKLEQIQEIIAPVLKELKLLIIHLIKNDYVITQIRDLESENYIESEIKIWKVESTRTEKFIDSKWKDVTVISYNEKDPQWVWGIISYYRRYNLLALLDLEQEDDDAQLWSNKANANDYQSKPKEQNKWYNDFDKQKDIMIDKIKKWETTAEKIVKDLKEKWYKLATKTEKAILELSK